MKVGRKDFWGHLESSITLFSFYSLLYSPTAWARGAVQPG